MIVSGPEEMPSLSLSQTPGLTSVTQLVDATANELFSFPPTTSKTEQILIIISPSQVGQEVETGYLPSYSPNKIVWERRAFLLRQEMACSVEAEEGLWVITYEPLRIRAYAGSRDDAIAEFSREFAMLWDDYAGAEDTDLTKDALAMKRYLRRIVREVSEE